MNIFKYNLLVRHLNLGLLFGMYLISHLVIAQTSSLNIPLNEFQNDYSFNQVSGKRDSIPYGYVAPLVSNGNLSLLIDYQGSQQQNSYYKMVPGIYKAGRRYGPPKDGLIPFGYFTQRIIVNGKAVEKPSKWTQTLKTKDALVECLNEYEGSFSVETKAITHLTANIIAVKKTFTTNSPVKKKVSFSFEYHFTDGGNNNKIPRNITCQLSKNKSTNGVDFIFQSDTYKPFNGITSFFANQKTDYEIDKQTVRLNSNLILEKGHPVEITYYIILSDSIDEQNFEETHKKLISNVQQEGFDGVFASHKKEWNAYFEQSYIKIPEPKLANVYYTSMYNLRANATKWSFPIGIYPTHWAGRYFGWDETFAFFGLVSSNHLDISKRVPDFRFSVLKPALDRAKHTSMTEENKRNYGAMFPWETLEDGREGSPAGFWLEHIIQMSHIAMAAWMQYQYSGDKEYLRKTGYPLIRECARFFNVYSVYENPDGSMFIGKVTDLERLGPARQNAFMTTTGVILTLENAAKAADLLNENKEEVVRWKTVAAKLRESLPQNGERYIPYPGCKEESIGTLAGLYPYPIFDKTNELQKKAVYRFIDKGLTYGNVTTKGDSIGAWYSAKIAASLAKLEDTKQTVYWLHKATSVSGCFGELFEIHEPKFSSFPWYAGIAGAYVYAVNQMLIQNTDTEIIIAPAVPDYWNDFAFKLGCFDNLVATVEINNGKLKKLLLTSADSASIFTKTLVIPRRFIDINSIDKANVLDISTKEDDYVIKISGNSSVSLIR